MTIPKQSGGDSYVLTAQKVFALAHNTFGFFGGGVIAGGAVSNIIDLFNLTLLVGNGLDTGDITVARKRLAGCRGSTYGFFQGGLAAVISNVIDWVTLLTYSQNAADKGDLVVSRFGLAGQQGTTYGFSSGGALSEWATYYNTQEYINTTTTSGNALDKGDLTVTRALCGGSSGATYGYTMGGYDGVNYNTLDYIDVTTTSGNATDKGDQAVARRSSSGLSGAAYSYNCGGNTGGGISNIIEYFSNSTTTGNALDAGDMHSSREGCAGSSDAAGGFGVVAGGGTGAGEGGAYTDYIDMTTTTVTGLGRGTLSTTREAPGGV